MSRHRSSEKLGAKLLVALKRISAGVPLCALVPTRASARRGRPATGRQLAAKPHPMSRRVHAAVGPRVLRRRRPKQRTKCESRSERICIVFRRRDADA